jgi:hypothetical protein
MQLIYSKKRTHENKTLAAGKYVLSRHHEGVLFTLHTYYILPSLYPLSFHFKTIQSKMSSLQSEGFYVFLGACWLLVLCQSGIRSCSSGESRENSMDNDQDSSGLSPDQRKEAARQDRRLKILTTLLHKVSAHCRLIKAMHTTNSILVSPHHFSNVICNARHRK